MSRLLVFTIAVLMLLPARFVAAQGSGTEPSAPQLEIVTLYQLDLRDGSRLYGDVVRQDESVVVFRTRGGTTLTVARADVVSLQSVGGVIADGEFLPSDPNATRLFFGPTGRSLKRGQTYLGVYEFALPFVQVGVTDRFSIGGGTPLVFGGGESGRPFWITPKLQIFDGGSTQVAVGAFHGFSGEGGYGGIEYAVATHGNTVSSFSIGAGMGYSGGGGGAGVVMLGGERQVRRNMKVITENYVWQGGHAIVSAGIRFFGDRLSADLALASPITEGFFVGPLVNFVYIF